MDPTQPTDPNQPQSQPGAAPMPQAPMSADLPPTPTPPDPAPAATPPPSWDTQAPQSAPVAETPPAAQPWNEAATPPAEPAAPAPEAPPVDQAPPQVSSDWSQPVAPVPDPAAAPDAPVAPMGMPAESGQPAPVDMTMPQPEARMSQEAAPTDLSSLAAALGAPSITGASGVQSGAPVEQSVGAPTQPPQTPAASDTPTVVTGSHGIHLPKWVIVVAAVVGLLAVVGSSAYFILGVGQTPEPSTSLPAEQQNLTNPPRSIIPTPTPVITDDGTSLGSISGASPSAQASPSGTLAPGASSVFDRRATQ